MAENQFTEVTSQSWFSRLGGAFKGVLFGLLLFVIAFPLLSWNEGRAVKRYKTLKEGEGLVVSVSADAVDAVNEGVLVHVTGNADTQVTLTDPIFGVSAQALKLNRVVAMYQWEEDSQSTSKKKVGGKEETTTTYTYAKVWSPESIDSSMFEKPAGHENPGGFAYPSMELLADPVSLGAYTLSSSLVEMIDNPESLSLTADTNFVAPEALKGIATQKGNLFYVGSNSAAPQIGDLRVSFVETTPTQISVMAQQAGSSFIPYQTEAGGQIQLLQVGTHTADEMIQQAITHNKIMTWVLRLVGFLLMLSGLNMVFKPLSVLADVLPILGKIVSIGTGLVSFLIALSFSTLTIAIAWLVFRPVLGISLLVVAGAITALVLWKLKTAQAVAPPAA
jgi:Transmembrane protein 43